MAGAAAAQSYTNRSGSPIRTNGPGYIAGEDPGLVTVAGAPASRKIEVYDIATGILVATTASAANGTWRVDNLNPARRYRVIAYDHQLVFNAVIRDNITPAVDE